MNWESLPVLLVPDEVAEILRITPKYVVDLCRAGVIAAVGLGPRGEWRIPRTSVQKFVQAAG